MPLYLPDEWKPHIDEIISSPGVVVVVGAPDAGKSSFCALLLNSAFAAGVPTAVVDSDIGQSEIGPPSTVGLGFVESEVQSLGEIGRKSFYFVGATSPVGHLLATATGAKRLLEQAVSAEKKLVIVDTSGFVEGPMARKLKTYKIELLGAKHVVALQKSGEAEHFLRIFDTWDGCTVHRLAVSPEARTKTHMLRTQRRYVKFREYFLRGEAREISLQSVSTYGTWLKTGKPLAARYLKFAERELEIPVLYGEAENRGVYLIAKGVYNRRGIESIEQQFRARHVSVVSPDAYTNLLVGLHGSRLELLALGIVQKIDFQSQTASVFTPLRSIAPVKSIRFGDLKLRPNGVEIGQTRPGEL